MAVQIKPVDWEEEQRALSGRRRLTEPGADWVLHTECARILCVKPASLYSRDGRAKLGLVRRKMRSTRATTPRSCGWLYWRRDVEQVAHIRRVARIGLSSAVRVFDAIRRGEITLEGSDESGDDGAGVVHRGLRDG